jgi:hypothetical protein
LPAPNIYMRAEPKSLLNVEASIPKVKGELFMWNKVEYVWTSFQQLAKFFFSSKALQFYNAFQYALQCKRGSFKNH